MMRWTAEGKVPALNNGLLSLRPVPLPCRLAITANLAHPASDTIPPIGDSPRISADLRFPYGAEPSSLLEDSFGLFSPGTARIGKSDRRNVASCGKPGVLAIV